MDDLNPVLAHRVYAIRHQLTEAPLCVCGKPCKLNYTYHDRGFRQFCSVACSRKKRRLPANVLSHLDDVTWLQDMHFNKRLSLQAIAEVLNVSPTPVKEAFDRHNIIPLDGRRMNSLATQVLENRELLYDAYITRGLKMQEIATEIGSSDGTVCKWLHYHGIEPRPANSYERSNAITSGECLEVHAFINSIYDGPIELNNRTICSGLELDLLMPEAKLAIEYNGVFHHLYRPNETSFSTIKGPKYHLAKTEAAEKQGIQLLHIFSDEWKGKQEIVKSMIAHRLGVSANRTYARNLTIVEVSSPERTAFFNDNHIQGSDKAPIRLGLRDADGKLLALMTFCKSRYNRAVQWELSRFACQRGHLIVGGFQRLLAHFVNVAKPQSIVSYADRRFSRGNVYEKAGFRLISRNAPSYYHVKEGTEIRLNRQNIMKKDLIETLDDHLLTEYELAKRAGYDRIYDCGSLTYVWGSTPQL